MPRFTGAAIALAIVLAACSTPSSGGAAGSGAFSITLSEFKFSPAELAVPAGRPFTLTVKNAGTIDHDLSVQKAGVHVLVKPGGSAQQEVGTLAAGTFEILCTIPGHKESGMVGKLVVK